MKKGMALGLGLTLTQFGMAIALVVGVTIKENALLRDKKALRKLVSIESATRQVLDIANKMKATEYKPGKTYDEVLGDFVFAASSINEILHSDVKAGDKEFMDKIDVLYKKYDIKPDELISKFVNKIEEEFVYINE